VGKGQGAPGGDERPGTNKGRSDQQSGSESQAFHFLFLNPDSGIGSDACLRTHRAAALAEAELMLRTLARHALDFQVERLRSGSKRTPKLLGHVDHPSNIL
jgi:hypothetical protein